MKLRQLKDQSHTISLLISAKDSSESIISLKLNDKKTSGAIITPFEKVDMQEDYFVVHMADDLAAWISDTMYPLSETEKETIRKNSQLAQLIRNCQEKLNAEIQKSVSRYPHMNGICERLIPEFRKDYFFSVYDELMPLGEDGRRSPWVNFVKVRFAAFGDTRSKYKAAIQEYMRIWEVMKYPKREYPPQNVNTWSIPQNPKYEYPSLLWSYIDIWGYGAFEIWLNKFDEMDVFAYFIAERGVYSDLHLEQDSELRHMCDQYKIHFVEQRGQYYGNTTLFDYNEQRFLFIKCDSIPNSHDGAISLDYSIKTVRKN